MKKKLKLIGNIVSIISILFVIKALLSLDFDFNSVTNWPVFIVVSLICVLVKCGTVFVSATAWYGWLAFFSGEKSKYKEGVVVYAKANIGKYLPGNVMHYVERNLFAGKIGISQKKLALSSLFEVLSLIGASFVIALGVSYDQLVDALEKVFGKNYKIIIISAIIVIVIFAALIVFVIKKKFNAILKEYTLKNFIATAVKNVILNSIVLILLGLIMVVLYGYMGGDVTLKKGSLIVSGYIIAWVLGFIVPGAPGGIGVREVVVTLLLGNVMGEDMVVTLSVIHRLITVIGDFLAYVVRLVIPINKEEN